MKYRIKNNQNIKNVFKSSWLPATSYHMRVHSTGRVSQLWFRPPPLPVPAESLKREFFQGNGSDQSSQEQSGASKSHVDHVGLVVL